MFFRTKRTPSGSVLQLLEAYRNGEGLPRQRVVVSLGNANLPKAGFARTGLWQKSILSRELKRRRMS